ncbi:translocation and assembly module lipoprotein TamL [Adhaeribacter soli]|uniref:BamA/TamA family outer membrane protein n=1 Tax=Adhaeribacter soli TaxID=2607655 RepID=A0A5N1INX8_9BACT|nr:BamA/TamA family outer membrane protein [Adhaeribacter soli]KAA9325190.1 BamA/TamA family outer membrane protein [Adhaeribacter soli]
MTTRVYILGLTITIFILAGCSPTRHLKGNEKLLYDLELNGVNQNKPEDIETLYRQQPNRKIPVIGWMPYLSVYNFGKALYNPAKVQRQIETQQARFDKKIKQAGTDSARVVKLSEKRENRLARLTRKKEQGNWLMRSVGEPPAIYDSVLTAETVSQINTYLNSKGFFHNKVNSEVKEKGKKVYLTLNVTENQPFKITEHAYNIPDTAVYRLVVQNPEKPVYVGKNYDEAFLTQERDRLETLLRNNGYYDFRKQFITFDVDTSYGGNTVRMQTVISNPSDTVGHKMYTIRKIFFVGDAGQDRFGVKRDTVVYNKVNYLWYNKYVNPKILDKKIRFSAGQPYSMVRTNRTLRQLADLDVYRFAAVNYTAVKDSLQPMLDAYVNVSPAKRFQESTEAGFNISTFTTSQLSPLPFGSIRFKVRNVFGGAENLELGLRLGLEAQPSSVTEGLVTTTELGGNVALYFPKFLFPLSLINKYNVSLYSPRTRINSAFTYTNREDYTRTITELSLDYFWYRSQRLQYILSLADINFVDVARISPAYQTYLESLSSRGIPLIETFKSGVISSVNATMLYNSNDINQTRDAKYIKIYAEIGNLPSVLTGGKTEGFSGWLADFISERTNNTLRSYSYVRFNADYRRYFKLKEKMFVVGRGNFGLATSVPKGNDNVLPYDKFYFAGGGSSLRAWRPRKLGPGSYSPPYRLDDNGNIVTVNGFPQRDYRPEQPGEILIESNMEYRFNIFSYFDGALFVDAGNVWTLKEDDSRPGGSFSKDFYKEIAVGTGFGLRMNFSFLIVRFDIATKVFDPAEPEGERFVLDRFRFTRMFSSKNMQNSFNLGIGYPF